MTDKHSIGVECRHGRVLWDCPECDVLYYDFDFASEQKDPDCIHGRTWWECPECDALTAIDVDPDRTEDR